MDWLIGLVSTLVLVVHLQKRWWAPIAGLVSEVFWIAYALMLRQYGLLPAVLTFCVVYLVAIPKWRKERKTCQTC